ncbi:MAG: hypothetical protein AB7K71_28950, partial [Polyangiaceae bacterium]
CCDRRKMTRCAVNPRRTTATCGHQSLEECSSFYGPVQSQAISHIYVLARAMEPLVTHPWARPAMAGDLPGR